jgi:hypothetical protein
MERTMYRLRCSVILWAAAFLAAAPGARAQQRPPTPHIGYVFPAGGRQGDSVQVTVGGQALAGAQAAYLSGQGVQATVGAYNRPLTQREVLALRDKLEEARKKLEGEGYSVRPGAGLRNLATLARLAKEAGITDAEIKALMEFQRSRTDPKKQLNPQIAEKVTLQIKIDPQATPGARELRLLTPLGLSNPIRFEIGQLSEYRETEPNDTTPDNGMGDRLPSVINGQITPGDVDRFSFTARKGTRLVAAAEARELIPYLADAVPGWFQAALALYDAKGHELAYADHFGFHHDPVLYCEIPQDGEYVLVIRDALYRGREDFVYRITLGEVPFVTSIFPLGGREGTPTTVAVKGWNLPASRMTPDTGAAGTGTLLLSVRKAELVSNGVPFAVDTLPECLEKEPDDQKSKAQRVTLPLIINGRMDKPGDTDVFRFEGRAGQEIVAEVCARRLNSPLDSVLTLTDAGGKQLAVNDDFEDRGAGLVTHQADSRLSVTLPVRGTYFLILRDAQHHGGEEYAYRLRISPPQPDFALRVVPSSIGARAGTTIPITVYALRRDGFVGDIALELKDAPGFRLSGGWVPAHQDKVRLTLTVPPTGAGEPVKLRMEGRAVLGGREIRRAAVPAEDMMQAFAYRHLVPAEDCMVAVAGRALFGPGVRPRDDSPVRLPAGGTARVRFFAPNRNLVDQLQLELSDPPEGIVLQSVEPEAGGVAIVLRADAAKIKPGLKGNLIIDAFREPRLLLASARPGAGQRRLPLGTLPAIPFEIVAP